MALRWVVSAKVVPLLSCRTTRAILSRGRRKFGLIALRRGSSQVLILPRNMSTYTSRVSFRSPPAPPDCRPGQYCQPLLGAVVPHVRLPPFLHRSWPHHWRRNP